MTLEQGLVAALRADSQVGPLVSNATSPLTYRIYREHLPQQPTYPAIVFARVTTFGDTILDGPSSLQEVLISLDVMALSDASRMSVASAVKAALNGVRGSLGGASVQLVHVTNEQDGSLIDGDQRIRLRSFDVRVHLHE